MLTNINAIKVGKLLNICAIIYDFFYSIKNYKKNSNILGFCFICIKLSFQKLQTSACTDVAPDARVFSHLVKFSKRGVDFILPKTHFRF